MLRCRADFKRSETQRIEPSRSVGPVSLGTIEGACWTSGFDSVEERSDGFLGLVCSLRRRVGLRISHREAPPDLLPVIVVAMLLQALDPQAAAFDLLHSCVIVERDHLGGVCSAGIEARFVVRVAAPRISIAKPAPRRSRAHDQDKKGPEWSLYEEWSQGAVFRRLAAFVWGVKLSEP